MWKKKSNVLEKRPREDYSNLKNRTNPMALRNAVAKFNETQKQSVRDLGFGALLHLDIKDMPPKIAYWVLDNFDTKRCEIVLEGDRRVRVGEDDVRLIFGFPRGPHPVLRKAKNAEASLSKEWWERFTDVDCRKILAKNVCDAAVEEVDGGIWFKRHFMVLVTYCLIESIGNSYMSPQILNNFREVDRVADLDWYNYVIKCLVEHTTGWQKRKEKFYTGPSLFITLLYMDRVVLGYRRVPRSIPTIKEWKDKMLLRRQNLEIEDGGFGNGFCSGTCTEAEVVAAGDEHEPAHVAAGDEAGGVRAEAQPDDGAPMEHQEEQLDGDRVEEELTDIKVVAAELLKKGKIISDTLSLIMSTISRLPTKILENAAFRKTVEATLLVSRAAPVPSIDMPCTS
ncbi:hypothetical protein C2S52_012630 [Perilla frutescens var. hirtella]|nr:hypothetical protein C2S52_012630 [Perilla frutescens var. hirtella]